MNAPTKQFDAVQAVRTEEPLLLGMIGPPGGGKTLSALRLAKGIQSVRGGDIVVIDTEGGRSRKYSDQIPFKIVELPIAQSDVLLNCIRAQLEHKPAAIIIDSCSDEHERYLAWHDEQVPRVGGNEWAAWAKPQGARRQLVNGILKIKTPLIFTFRAREKTKQDTVNGKKTVINIGWQPIAPLEIVHTLDLTCILPPRADGVPVWKSDKIGEDFIIKLPNYLAPYIEAGKPLDEQMGAAFARWAKGGSPVGAQGPTPPADAPAPPVYGNPQDGAGEVSLMDLDIVLSDAAKLGTAALKAVWITFKKEQRDTLQVALDRRHKPAAAKADSIAVANAAIAADAALTKGEG